ncbi:MAG: twin-arginine translocation signal domain-containing protein [Actinobacteria bacterium]|nr:MAG: twin-arginine translocation signal domain-containing protein [Actinomycetota bacterium]
MSEKKSFDRREFLRKAAITGATAAWAVPVIQTVAATPAFAQTAGTPCPPGGCGQSSGCNGGCMPACSDGAGCGGNQCGQNTNGPCWVWCHNPGNGNICCNVGLCNPANFTCSNSGGAATYTGSLAGCGA